ncbi:MAG TPA: phosphoglycerate dehydrogenase [Chloroflexota bacterium]|nr:phosphoglycerate dehydrogenase [Chloroflexota bacterium]
MATVLVTLRGIDLSAAGPLGALLRAGHALRAVPRDRSTPLAEAARALEGCAAVVAGGERYDAALFDAAPHLKHVARFGAGYDAVDVAAASARGILVTNGAGSNAQAVADLTLGLMLAAARNIPLHDRTIRAGTWQNRMGADVWRQTLGIVGLGRIGQAVARRARGFEMTLLAYDPYPNTAAARDLGVELTALDRLFSDSDFVTLHLPASQETEKLVAARLLGLMKPTAFFINAARGPLVDEDALYAALKENRIAGAGLDVRTPEPPTDTRFNSLDNVVMTPHTGAGTPIARWNSGQAAAESVVSALNGERPEGLINPEAWERFTRR